MAPWAGEESISSVWAANRKQGQMNHQADSDTNLGQTKSSSALRELLAVYREKSKTEREKGTYFELLIRDFLKHDPTWGC
jgi:hypothetical protein